MLFTLPAYTAQGLCNGPASVRPSVRLSVCLSRHSTAAAVGLLSSALWAGYIAGELPARCGRRTQAASSSGARRVCCRAPCGQDISRAPYSGRQQCCRQHGGGAQQLMRAALCYDGVGWLDTDGSNEADYTQSCAHTRGIGQTVTARSANTTEACDAERRLAKCRRTGGIQRFL